MKDACKNGHPYPESAYVRLDNGHRFCRRCDAERRYQKRRDEGRPRKGEPRGKLNKPRDPVPANTNELGYIPLTQGKHATVDIADYAFLSQWNWQAIRNGGIWYAQRTENRKRIGIPDALLGIQAVDHRDHDGLNNRRSNLRPATYVENTRNTRLYKNSTTGFKGVSIDRGKLRARIQVNGKSIHLGHFGDAEQAAYAYDAAARLYFGEFACLNF